MSKIHNLLFVCLIAGSVCARAEGAVITVGSHINDGSTLNGTASFEVLSANGRILAGGGGSGQFTGIYYFPLPAIPSESFLATSNLGLTILSDTTASTALPIDLYGLGYITGTPPTAINNTWHYVGTNDTRTGTTLGTNIGANPITKIANDFLIGGTSIPDFTLVETDAVQDSALTTFINSLFDNGAVAGDYAAIRLNADSVAASGIRFNFGSRDNSTPGYQPFLSFDIQEVPPIPEPSTLGLLVIGLIGLQRRSRTRRCSSK